MYRRKLFTILLILLTTIFMMSPFNAVLLADFQGLGGGGGQAGTSISANVTASAIYLVEYEWAISKSANASEVYLSRNNPTAIVKYTVTVVKTLKTESYYIVGEVCVNNTGGRATENLAIALDVYVGVGWRTQIIDDYPVNVSAKPVLQPSESYCYPYKVDIPRDYWNYTSFKVTANVTITNHSGQLGKPYGPSPSATDTRSDEVMYNCITVEDTAGYEWNTCSNSTWEYNAVFSYDPGGEEYSEHSNTATIIETGQSATWTVKLYQEIARYAMILGTVFWDNNYNGRLDRNDKPIYGVAVYLFRYNEETGEWIYIDTAYSNENGYYSFNVEAGYTYRVVVAEFVCEFCNSVVSTTPMYYVIEKAEGGATYGDKDFGFVCLNILTGAYSKGYWSWSTYDRRIAQWRTRIAVEDVTYINNQLGTNFRTAKELADFLVSPVLGNMTRALMQQLIATLLNLKYGYVSENTTIYYNGRFITIGEAVENAKIVLRNGDRATQEYWKDVLDAINNNSVHYVHTM